MNPDVRRSSRVVIVDPTNRVLLLRVHDESPKELVNPMPDDFWTTIGGSLEPGESFEEAARREIHEETGLEDVELDRWVWERHSTTFRSGERRVQYERFYTARTTSTDVTEKNQSDSEKDDFVSFRWWSLDELESSSEAFTPVRLTEIVRAAVTGTQQGVLTID